MTFLLRITFRVRKDNKHFIKELREEYYFLMKSCSLPLAEEA